MPELKPGWIRDCSTWPMVRGITDTAEKRTKNRWREHPQLIVSNEREVVPALGMQPGYFCQCLCHEDPQWFGWLKKVDLVIR